MSEAIELKEALQCKKCGAPMKTRRECGYCGTTYYIGPEIPEQLEEHGWGIPLGTAAYLSSSYVGSSMAMGK